MENKEIRDMFRKCEAEEIFSKYIMKERKCAGIRELRMEAAKKAIVPKATKLEMIRNQLRFMDKKIMAVQMVCFILILLLYMTNRQKLWGDDLIAMGTIAAALFSIFEAYAFSREEACGISEVAGACYFNNRQICVLHMILHTSINMISLGVMILLIWGNVDRRLYEIGIYLLVPFLVTGCIQFGVLLWGAGRRGNIVLTASGIFMVLLFAVMSSVPEIYEHTALGIWLAVLAVGGGLFIGETALLLRRVEKGEVLCMN